MAPVNQIRRAPCAGSGIGETNPAANSRAEDRAEKPAPGAATGKVVALIAGGELHAEQAGSRINIVILTGKGLRNRLTASLSPADAERFFQAGAEIVPLARSYRQAKGA